MRVLKTHDKLNKFGIPLGYTRVEYLESTGVQYIDTGYKPVPATTKFEFMFQCDNISDNTFLFGARPDTSAASQYTCTTYKATSRIRQDWAGLSDFFTDLTTTDKYIYTAYNNTITLNDTTVTGTMTRSTNRLDYNFLLFTVNTGGTVDSRMYVGKIYYAKLWDDGVLIRNYIPCLDLFGKPCLYDFVEHKTYYNQGSGDDFTVGRKILPVEYLESNGGQYIDTGIQPTDEYGYRIKNTYTTGQGEQCAIGSMVSGNRFVGVYTSGATNQLSGAWANFVGFLPDYPWVTGTVLDVKCNYKNDRKIIVDNTELKDISNIHITGTISNSIYIGARNYGHTVTTMKGKIYSVEITKGLDTVANYIPCKDENNIGFMFDTVGNNVYLNKGTGSFTFGEEVYDYKNTVRFIKDGITGNLPRGYTRVEYLEAENVGMTYIQYAVGNYRLTDTTDWEITFSAEHSGNSWIMGQPTWVGVHYRKDATTNNLTKVGIVNSSTAINQCYIDYTNNEKITLALKGTDVYANGVKVGSITRVSAASTQTKYGIFAYKDITQDLPNLRVESAKIYDIKIWDNNVLVQHLIPVLDMNGEGCFYDTVNKITIRKEDNCNGDFTSGSKVSSGLRLLAGGSIEDYIFLDYLESTGTQWIDTEYIGNSNTKVEVKCYSENTSQNRALFGARDGGAYLNSFTIWQIGNEKIRFDYSADVSYTLRAIDWDPTVAHTIVKDGAKNYVDGVELSSNNPVTFDCNFPFSLFGVNTGGSAQSGTLLIGRVYYCKIYDDNTLTRNFLPVLRKSDNKPGMYDIVEGKFYVNQATGADFNYGYKQ